ncbi:MAG: hypothetical protein ACI8ZM_002360 [Crocinitomix sp.]|jgi:hypothetical protein
MIEWYFPFIILPGLGLLILSTTGLMLGISSEVGALLANKCTKFEHMISDLKIKQIRRLTRAATLLYTAAGMYVLSGVIGAAIRSYNIVSHIVLYAGTLSVLIALILLIQYSYKTVGIRKLQFDNNQNLE